VSTPVDALRTILQMRCSGFRPHLFLHIDRQEDFDSLLSLVPAGQVDRSTSYVGGEFYDDARLNCGDVTVTMFGPGRPGELPAGVVDIHHDMTAEARDLTAQLEVARVEQASHRDAALERVRAQQAVQRADAAESESRSWERALAEERQQHADKRDRLIALLDAEREKRAEVERMLAEERAEVELKHAALHGAWSSCDLAIVERDQARAELAELRTLSARQAEELRQTQAEYVTQRGNP
jgi:hypothetical protein